MTNLQIAARLQAIPPSPTLAISNKAKALKDAGIDVVSFGAGEPDFPTPAAVCQAAKAAIDSGKHGYTAVSGIPELKHAIAETYRRDLGIDVTPAEIIASCGAKHTLYNLFLALLNPGDEVIVPSPYWVSYPVQIEMAGGVPVPLPGDPSADFLPTIDALDAAITPRTRAIVLNNPSNPTGMLWGREALENLGDWLLKHPNIAIISDAIYRELCYDGPYHELLTLRPALRERYILVDGVSKSFAMTGWRLGWAVAPAAFTKAMENLQSQSTSNPTSITQWAAVEALRQGEGMIAPMRERFKARRDLITARLNELPDVSLNTPRGAFYAFPDFSAYIGRAFGNLSFPDDLALTAWLLEEAQVALVPGSSFGAPGYMRLSYATSEALIEKGLDRIQTALATLRSKA